MIVRFVWVKHVKPEGPPETGRVEYGFGDARVPIVGESVEAMGDDPEFPQGTYRVLAVKWEVALRGPRVAVCIVEWLP